MSNEKKYTQEEIKAIVEEELRKANLAMGTELNMDEMETVAGGNGYTGHDAPGGNSYVVPKTHEEIDAKWDIIDYTLKAISSNIYLTDILKNKGEKFFK